MIPFLITGMPRSRTAWLAAACLTVPGVMCYHEPLEEAPSWQAAASLWRAPTAYEFLGIADSGFGFHLVELHEQYRPRILVVERDIDAVQQSMQAAGIPSSRRVLEVLKRRLDLWKLLDDDRLILRVPFEELDERLPQCFEHLLPGCAVDSEKLRQLGRLNVQADLRRVLAGLRERSGEVGAILGADVMAELGAV